MGKNHLKWYNPYRLGAVLAGPDATLEAVRFYTAPATWNRSKHYRYMQYRSAIQYLGVELIESTFKKTRKHCAPMKRYCKRHEEKKTDVAIALDAYCDALSGVERIILVTADSDQVPTVERICADAPHSHVRVAFPPQRKGEARELGGVAHSRKELTIGLLGSILMPREVRDGVGRLIASRPTEYEP